MGLSGQNVGPMQHVTHVGGMASHAMAPMCKPAGGTLPPPGRRPPNANPKPALPPMMLCTHRSILLFVIVESSLK